MLTGGVFGRGPFGKHNELVGPTLEVPYFGRTGDLLNQKKSPSALQNSALATAGEMFALDACRM